MNLDPLLLDYWGITGISFNAYVPPRPPHPCVGLPDPQVPLFGHYGALTPAQLGVRRCVRRFLLDPFGIWLSY